MSSLSEVDFSVPSSPGDSGVEHSSSSAHVSEGSLSGSVGSGSSDSGNSCDGSTGSPGLGVVHHTGVLVYGVGLSSVLVQVVEDEMDDIVSDGSEEDVGDSDFSDGGVGVLRRKNSDDLS